MASCLFSVVRGSDVGIPVTGALNNTIEVRNQSSLLSLRDFNHASFAN